MKLLRHVLPARLRPVVRAVLVTVLCAALVLVTSWGTWTLIEAFHKQAEHERWDPVFRVGAARAQLFEEVGEGLRSLEAECVADLRLPPAQRWWSDPNCSYIRSLRAAAEQR